MVDPGPLSAHRRCLAEELRQWLEHLVSKSAYITPGSPWENGYCELFNGRMRDELLNSEIFYTLREAQVVIEHRRRHYFTNGQIALWADVHRHLRP